MQELDETSSKLNIIQNIIPVDISFCIKDRETIKNQDYRLFNELMKNVEISTINISRLIKVSDAHLSSW